MADSATNTSELKITDSLIRFNINPTKLIVVKSPCILRDLSKYLPMLGCSAEERNEIFSNKEDRLPFRFRPGDSHSKPAFADPTSSAALLIKVKIPRKHSDNNNCIIECLGVVETLYKFKRPFDFQFLSPALHPLPSKFSLDDYSPYNTLIDSSQLKCEIPLFALPASNAKLDWAYLPFKPSDKELSGRVKSFGSTHGIPFEEASVPDAPRKKVRTKEYLLPILEALFQERPVWSRAALNCKTAADSGSLRSALSHVAYHFSSGPWKFSWIKLGIDPRLHPKYKWYQVVECKLARARHARSRALQASDYSFTSSLTDEAVKRESVNSRVVPEYVRDPRSYILTAESSVHTTRLSYQLIDIEIESVRELVESTDGSETVCTKETGWFSAGVYEQIRNLVKTVVEVDAYK